MNTEPDMDPVCWRMLRIKLRLENLIDSSTTAKNADLRDILQSVKTFLKNHCDHQYVRDYIDITPDRGMTVIYCELCETVFE
jgi:hypothetical protein